MSGKWANEDELDEALRAYVKQEEYEEALDKDILDYIQAEEQHERDLQNRAYLLQRAGPHLFDRNMQNFPDYVVRTLRNPAPGYRQRGAWFYFAAANKVDLNTAVNLVTKHSTPQEARVIRGNAEHIYKQVAKGNYRYIWNEQAQRKNIGYME